MQPAPQPCSGIIYLKIYFLKSLFKLKYLNADMSFSGASCCFFFLGFVFHNSSDQDVGSDTHVLVLCCFNSTWCWRFEVWLWFSVSQSRLLDYSIPLSSEATGDRGQNPNLRIIIGSLLSGAHTVCGCGEDCHTFWLYFRL